MSINDSYPRNYYLLVIFCLTFELCLCLPTSFTVTTVPTDEDSSATVDRPITSSPEPGITEREGNINEIFASGYNDTEASVGETTISQGEGDEAVTWPKANCDGLYEQLCDSGIECILKEHMCDGREDCRDGSDEDPNICQYHRVDGYQDSKGRFLPPTFKCPETWFFCKDASRCIEPASACNGVPDCSDGSDEASFCHYLNVERIISDSIDSFAADTPTMSTNDTVPDS